MKMNFYDRKVFCLKTILNQYSDFKGHLAGFRSMDDLLNKLNSTEIDKQDFYKYLDSYTIDIIRAFANCNSFFVHFVDFQEQINKFENKSDISAFDDLSID